MIDRLNELLRHEGGKLFWRVSRGRVNVGQRAGTLRPDGYRHVNIDGKLFQEHRVIFAMLNGLWPENEIDHINGIRDDNRPENLREATPSQNQWNTGPQRNNTSGKKGVCWNKIKKQWQASISANGKQVHLGYFHEIEMAELAYASAADRFHREFARTA